MSCSAVLPGVDALSERWAWLLAPYTRAEFERVYWERKPLLIKRGRSDYYEGLPSRRDLGDVITSGNLRHPSVRLVRDEKQVPAGRYLREAPSRDGGTSFYVDAGSIGAEYRSGSTIIFPAIHRHWRPLAILCRALEAESSFDVQANAYLTPAMSTGFAPHFDSHDVIVLQIEGSKRWTVFEHPAIELPLPSEACNAGELDLSGSSTKCLLETGDFLYIPRGHVHQACTEDTSSLHLTLSVKPPIWVEVLQASIEQIARQLPQLRRALPFGFAQCGGVRRTADETLPEMIADLAEAMVSAPLIDKIADRFVLGRLPFPTDIFERESFPGPIEAESQLVFRDDLFCRIVKERDHVNLLCPGRKVRFPAHFAEAIEHLCTTRSGCAGELPGPISRDERLLLMRRLVDEGILLIQEN